MGLFNLFKKKSNKESLNEKPVFKSSDEAKEWFRKGMMYGMGDGVEKDLEQAVYWLKKAADYDYPEAKTKLAIMYINGNYLPKDEKKAFRLVKEAAEAEDPDVEAFSLLGACYREGVGVRIDMDKAIYWVTKAAEAGNGDAQADLAAQYLYGFDVKQNPDKALFWIKKGMEQNNTRAKIILGTLHLDGYLVSKDPKRGFQLIKEAAEDEFAPDSVAFYNLGRCYCEGLGVARDLEQSRYWFRKAINAGISRDELNLYFREHPELRLSV